MQMTAFGLAEDVDLLPVNQAEQPSGEMTVMDNWHLLWWTSNRWAIMSSKMLLWVTLAALEVGGNWS